MVRFIIAYAMQKNMTRKLASEILTAMFVYVGISSECSLEQLRHAKVIRNTKEIFDYVILPVLKKYSGKFIRTSGDSFLMTFTSPTDAVHCGVELQKTVLKYNKKEEVPMMMRVAIHRGEVIHGDEWDHGEAVDIAAVIANYAKEGQVVFSEAVFSEMDKSLVSANLLRIPPLFKNRLPIILYKPGWQNRLPKKLYKALI